MKLSIILAGLCFFCSFGATAKTLEHYMQTRIGVFDACSQTFTYSFLQNKKYDVKTTLETKGTFGVFYPFKGMYHAYGYYDKDAFKPENYFYETDSFRHRTKEIVYENGVPQYRISVKDKRKRKDAIHINEKYAFSHDLLSVFAGLVNRVINRQDCNFEQYSFNGKKYSLVTGEFVKNEFLQTPYFAGNAMKCRLAMQVLDDTEAGFFFDKDEKIDYWILKEPKTGLPFVAKVFVASTPLGQLESYTTKIEVKSDE